MLEALKTPLCATVIIASLFALAISWLRDTKREADALPPKTRAEYARDARTFYASRLGEEYLLRLVCVAALGALFLVSLAGLVIAAFAPANRP